MVYKVKILGFVFENRKTANKFRTKVDMKNRKKNNNNKTKNKTNKQKSTQKNGLYIIQVWS